MLRPAEDMVMRAPDTLPGESKTRQAGLDATNILLKDGDVDDPAVKALERRVHLASIPLIGRFFSKAGYVAVYTEDSASSKD